jgi:hypothetical protein
MPLISTEENAHFQLVSLLSSKERKINNTRKVDKDRREISTIWYVLFRKE